MGALEKLAYWLQPELRRERDALKANLDSALSLLASTQDELAKKTMELANLKLRIAEKAQQVRVVRPKTAAEVRRLVEQQNEKELEEINGI